MLRFRRVGRAKRAHHQTIRKKWWARRESAFAHPTNLPRDPSTQRALEIKTRIGRLLRRDRAIGGQQPSSEHVVAGAVDGFDADEFFSLVAERRERSLGAIAAHNDAVIAGGEPRDLQLVGSLI